MRVEHSLEGKRLAIFGATSNIAETVTTTAVHEGAQVVAFVRSESKAQGLKQVGGKNIEIVVGDIRVLEDVLAAVKGRDIDATINFAALTHQQSANTASARPVNVNGEMHVLRATEDAYIPRHIFISTIGVHMRGPNAYKDTKLEAEKLVRDSTVPEWFILRFANVIGTQSQENIWNNPFLTLKILGQKIGLALIPSKKDAPFPYLGIKTATDATLHAVTASRPNQTITILDGFTTVDTYLEKIGEINDLILQGAVPSTIMIPLVRIANNVTKALGKNFPITPGAVELVVAAPQFSTKPMEYELGITPRSFETVIYQAQKTHTED